MSLSWQEDLTLPCRFQPSLKTPPENMDTSFPEDSSLAKSLDSIIDLLNTVQAVKRKSLPTERLESVQNEIRKIFPVKRKHHHVWAYYLRSWSDGKNIPYISKTGKISNASIAGLAQKKDFYKLQKIEADELPWIEACIAQAHPKLQALHKKDWNGTKRWVKKLRQPGKKAAILQKSDT